MHVIAGLDVALGHADHGVELADLRSLGNGASGDLVPRGHLRAHAQA